MKRGIWNFIIVLVISQLVACATDTALTHPVIVNSRDEAAAVLISVNTVAPWDQIIDAVQPNFSLTGDQALQQVVPNTARIQEQVLRAFGASLGLGLSSGSLTNPPQVPSDTPAGGQLPTAPSVTGDIGMDPILKYQAALALYQSVQLMNREVQYAAMKDDFVPYLVTMKFAIMPYRRNLPYDIHARIAFFPGSEGGPESDTEACKALSKNAIINAKLPLVLPILVTDDIERALKSRAVDVAQQIGLALSTTFQGVGGSLGLNNVNQTLKAISGQDINSRLTVTRLSDNTIYARIGASYESTAGLALVGQTYNVSLLILVPFEYFAGNNCKPQIEMVTHNEFRNAFDGTILAGRSTATLLRQGDEAIQASIAGKYDELYAKWKVLDDQTKEKILRSLAGPIQTSSFSGFEEKLRLAKDKEGQALGLDKIMLDYKNGLWTRLSFILADSMFKTHSFELPRPSAIAFEKQTPLLLDDNKDKSLLQLQVISGLTTSKMTAALKIKNSRTSESYQLLAQTINLNADTGVLTLTFPSIAKSRIDTSKFDDIELVIGQRCLPSAPSCPKISKPDSFKPLYVAVKAEDAETNLAFKSEVTKIVPTKSGGYATVTIDPLNNDFALINVQGADVDKATDSSGAQLPISNHKVKVTKPTTITYHLRNLNAGTQFTIQAEGYKSSKSAVKKEIQFIVVGR